MSAVEQRTTANKPSTRFARALRERRSDLRMSQTELATKIGVQTQTVSQWERSAKRPQPRFYDQLVEFLDLEDRARLRQMLDDTDVPVRMRTVLPSEVAPLEATRAERLSLVPDPGWTVEGGGEHGAEEAGRASNEVDAIGLLRAAISIIDARQGRLTESDAKIVQSLLDCHHRMGRPGPRQR